MNIDSISHKLGGVFPVGDSEFLPMTEGEIHYIEGEIGVHLPQIYRSLLEKFGAFTFNLRPVDRPYVCFRPKTRLPAYITGSDLAAFDFFMDARGNLVQRDCFRKSNIFESEFQKQ